MDSAEITACAAAGFSGRQFRGLNDGLQVAVAVGLGAALASALGKSTAASLEQAAIDGVLRWEPGSSLEFGVTTGATRGCAEINLFTVPSGLSKIAETVVSFVESSERTYTNGRSVPGFALDYAGIAIDLGNLESFWKSVQPSPLSATEFISLLVAHETGHALGLWHPGEAANGDPCGVAWNVDTDGDAQTLPLVDPADPLDAGWAVSMDVDLEAVMMSTNTLTDEEALARGPLRNDDIAGRDFLYPVPEPARVSLSLVGALVLISAKRLRRGAR